MKRILYIAILFAFLICGYSMAQDLKSKEDCLGNNEAYKPNSNFKAHKEGQKLDYRMSIDAEQNSKTANDVKLIFSTYRDDELKNTFETPVRCYGMSYVKCRIDFYGEELAFSSMDEDMNPISLENNPYLIVIPDFQRIMYRIQWAEGVNIKYHTPDKYSPSSFLPNIWIKDNCAHNKE